MNAWHTTAELVSPASEQAVTDPRSEEAAIYNTTWAAANTTIHTVGEAVLLVPEAREAAPSEEESQAVPASLVSNATGTHAARVDSMGHAIVKAVTDEVGAAANTAGRNGVHETAMAMCAAKRSLPTGATMIAPNSAIAEVAGPGVAAATPGSWAESRVICAGDSSASSTGQCSSSKSQGP
jgi:hypothetical protein